VAAELEFRVMGTNAHLVVVAADARHARQAALAARDRLHALETRWSRFLPDSEVSRLNAASGAPVVVSADTLGLVERAVEGWRRTQGSFDPTVLDALVAQGYDRDFDAIDHTTPAPLDPRPSPGCAGITVDRVVGAVRLPRGVHFDPGGIGKGFAADLAAAELMAHDVDGVCVNLGGDLRVEGQSPDGHGWIVDLEHPLTGRSMTRVRLRTGAVASTWRTRRVWGPPPARRHHLIDPGTGEPAATGLAGTTVLAGRAWWAEVLAKAAFLEGATRGGALLAAHQASGYLIDDDGTVHAAGLAEKFAA
jgi:thiamine biosynthesis lipoprotein